jgi:hypothetical protein
VSTHSEPRRWKQNSFDGPIHWREDKATSADVEAVAKWLAQQRGIECWDEMDSFFDKFKVQTRREAADLLARIFKEGGGR